LTRLPDLIGSDRGDALELVLPEELFKTKGSVTLPVLYRDGDVLVLKWLGSPVEFVVVRDQGPHLVLPNRRAYDLIVHFQVRQAKTPEVSQKRR